MGDSTCLDYRLPVLCRLIISLLCLPDDGEEELGGSERG